MQSLAAFAMRGRPYAVGSAGVLGILGLALPAVGILSAAVVGLVTLRQGLQEGLLATGGAAALTALGSYLLFASPLPVLGLLLLSWGPIWLVGTVLRLSRSLDLGLLAAAAVGLVAILVVYAQAGEPRAFWTELLEPIRVALVSSQGIEEATSHEVVAAIAVWMTGAFAGGLFLQLAVTLFLARWWQAVLYNPGGFGAEFRQLRFPALLAYGAVALVGLNALGAATAPDWARDLLILVVVVYLTQGLAVLHGLVAQTGTNRIWLAVLYLMLVFFLPHAALVVSGLGLVDTWVNIRARIPASAGRE